MAIKKPTTPAFEATAGPATNLVAAYLFSDGSGTTLTDFAGGGHDGTLTDMDPGSDWVTDTYGLALDFDGSNDKVVVSDHADFDITGDFTLVARLKGIGADATGYAVQKGVGTGAGAPYRLGLTSDGKPVVDAYIDGAARNITADAADAVSDTKWHTVAAHYNGVTFTLYLDGEPIKSAAQTGAVLATDGDLFIGQDGGSTARFDGRIDNVLLWDRALTASEMVDAHLNPFAAFRDVFPTPVHPFAEIAQYAMVGNEQEHGPVFRGLRRPKKTRRFEVNWDTLTNAEKTTIFDEYENLSGNVGWFWYRPRALGEATAVLTRFLNPELRGTWQGKDRWQVTAEWEQEYAPT